MTGRRISIWAVLTLMLTPVLAACIAPTRTPAPTGEVSVLADASLTGALAQIGRDFEAANPGVRVALTFAGSADLAGRIAGGAGGDVFAAADATTMGQVAGAGRAAGEPSIFAGNELVIAVPISNPGRVASLADLARVRTALCDEREPCGEAAGTVLASAGVTVTPIARAPDVKATLAYVLDGRADAALVYRTDARAVESQVATVEFMQAPPAAQECQAVPLTDAPNGQAAQAFVAYLTSEPGRAVLDAAGFLEP